MALRCSWLCSPRASASVAVGAEGGERRRAGAQRWNTTHSDKSTHTQHRVSTAVSGQRSVRPQERCHHWFTPFPMRQHCVQRRDHAAIVVNAAHVVRFGVSALYSARPRLVAPRSPARRATPPSAVRTLCCPCVRRRESLGQCRSGPPPPPRPPPSIAATLGRACARPQCGVVTHVAASSSLLFSSSSVAAQRDAVQTMRHAMDSSKAVDSDRMQIGNTRTP